MGVHVRGIAEAEFEPLLGALFVAFGDHVTAEAIEDDRAWIDVDRLLAAEEGGELVGSAGAYSFAMTLPGGAQVPVAGVTWVGVLPTHRRRGVLTAMMRRQLHDVVDRGEAIAVLTASEASIYSRFGYGIATRLARVRVDTSAGFALRDAPAVGGRIRLVDAGRAEAEARRLLDDVVPLRVGELTRPDGWWTAFQQDRERDRDGASKRFWVVHESQEGIVDGFAHYRVKEVVRDGTARSEVHLGEVVAVDPEVEAALLAYLTDIDLTTVLLSRSRPVDDPFRLRLVDDRRYRVELVQDHLHVRLLDVATALAARRYGSDEAVVVGVDDPFRPATSGRYRLEAGACERIGDLHDGDADAFCTVDVLGALYLGDLSATRLAHAGRLRPSSPERLAVLDRLFHTAVAPFCTMRF